MASANAKIDLTYDGSKNPKPDKTEYNEQGQLLMPYIPDGELKESVRLAIALKRPLLLMGEPGCGKTKLASAIAYEFTQRNKKVLAQHDLKEWPFFRWYVKSTSKARDGLYTYDAVARLRDAQFANSEHIADKEKIIQRLQDSEQTAYINYGPLGQAFRCPLRAVMLIDEIDKADIDFPNDLLRELDEGCFFIDELQRQEPQTPGEAPIVLITSNNERPLPDAFLRRCFFHFFTPPGETELTNILTAHFGKKLPKLQIPEIIKSFEQVRDLGQERMGGKQVSTSELLDWVNALLLEPEQLSEQIEKQLGGTFVHQGVLLKTRDEQLRYERQRTDDSQ